MKAIRHYRGAIAVAAGALLLVACGGGGERAPVAVDPPLAGSDVPASATSSSAGALAFVKSVAASNDNTGAPLVVGEATLATSDTDEPDPSI